MVPAKRILVVEDDHATAQIMITLLSNTGYEVLGVVDNGRAAFESIKASTPDVILMDIHLNGDLDGIQTAKIIRDGHDIPVVFVTAEDDAEFLTRVVKTEPFGYIIKPFHSKDLVSNIEIAYYKHQTEQKIREREQYLNDIANVMAEGLCVVDAQGIVTYMNPETERILGWSEADLMGQQLHNHIYSDEDEQRNPESCCGIQQCLKKGESLKYETSCFRNREGTCVPVSYSVSPMMMRNEINGAVIVFRDISDLQNAQEKLEHLATHDPLTDLLNRGAGEQQLREEIKRAHRYKSPLSLLMLDVDHFKQINDTHGHQTGDKVLIKLAKCLLESIRQIDKAFRYGGEEFVVFLPEASLESAAGLAERIREHLDQQKDIIDEVPGLHITVSIGVSTVTHKKMTLEELINAADDALFAAKRGGRNRISIADGHPA